MVKVVDTVNLLTGFLLQVAPSVQSQYEQANTINWNTVILAVCSLLTTVVTTFGGIYLYKIKGATYTARDAAQSTQESVDQIHTAVNSERMAMLRLVDDLKNQILMISKANAVLTEQAAQRPPSAAPPGVNLT